MFSYEYTTEYGKYRTTFYDDWERLNYCNAATYNDFHYTYDNALGHEIKTHDFYLMSYSTPIAKARYVYDLSTEHILTQRIYVNVNSWNCSRSTIKQLARWLKELNYKRGISIPYYELKEVMLDVERYGFRSAETQFPSGTGFVVIPYDAYELEDVFRTQCPIWSVSKC